MRVAITQMYMRAGVNFPFSHRMQRWVSDELSSSANDDHAFVAHHGPESKLVLYINAERNKTSNEIKGPASRNKVVEYTIVLPFDTIMASARGCEAAMTYLVDGVRTVFRTVGISTKTLDEREQAIVTHVCTQPDMLSGPWPSIVKPP